MVPGLNVLQLVETRAAKQISEVLAITLKFMAYELHGGDFLLMALLHRFFLTNMQEIRIIFTESIEISRNI